MPRHVMRWTIAGVAVVVLAFWCSVLWWVW